MPLSFELLRNASKALLALPVPPRCPGCGLIVEADHRFCAPCWMSLEFLSGPSCSACGLPFPYDQGEGALCGECLRELPQLDGVRAAVAYGDVARALALRLKHGNRPGYAKTIGRHMVRLINQDQSALLIPVPLHRRRIWSRGYNQAALITKLLAKDKGLAFELDLLQRVKSTPMLKQMGPVARKKAVRSAFAVAKDKRASLAGRAIILVDDVYTTGATANACARALKRSGAASVRLICWARVIPNRERAVEFAAMGSHLLEDALSHGH